ncbi:MAG: methionyl-tRNA formyltransferase [Lachnospiraceae bacterium]|nr:methionyl-tRNA formyltransferase [Lachnospiraceae bacterium]
MRVVFMGTPDFARTALEALIKAGHKIVLVVTQPDKPKGRSGKLQISDVKDCAIKNGIEVFQPEKIKEESSVSFLKSIDADIYVVAAFGQIISKEILDIPRYGCINIHASLLPKYRGAAPIQQAILDGEKVTGVTIQQMNTGVDTGDILLQREYAISDDETGGSLFDRLSILGADLVIEALDLIEKGKIIPRPQDESKATHCGKIKKDMGLIDWSWSAEKIERYIRGLNPWPSAYTYMDGRQLKIWKAYVSDEKGECATVLKVDKKSITIGCGEGSVRVLEVQLEGKKRMEMSAFLLGNRILEGDRIG